jgi:uncharacterized membrane protein
MVGLVWLHLLAAVVWIGGMTFLSLVLVPVLKRDGRVGEHAALFKTVALRFRSLVWGAMAILVASGPVLAANRAIPLAEPGRWPALFAGKIALVTLLLFLTLLHDLVVGPAVRRLLARPETERTSYHRLLLKYSVLVPRASLLLALLILFLAVVLARS